MSKEWNQIVRHGLVRPLGALYTGMALLSGWIAMAGAHSGSVVLAVPLEGIRVDGDLSDWPAGITANPLQWQGGLTRPEPGERVHGTVQLGYSMQENALYVGMQGPDQSRVSGDPHRAVAYLQDGAEVYLIADHNQAERYMAQFWVWGPMSAAAWAPGCRMRSRWK